MPREIIANLSKTEERYLDIAMNLARSSTVRRYKHGAVVVKGGRIVSTGINKVRNHPDVLESPDVIKSDAHVHAEVDAIRKGGDLRGAKIYVARVNRSGFPGLSRPCESCYGRIVEAGVTKIVYT